MTAELAQWKEAILRGDVRSISRALTLVESCSGPEATSLLRALFPHSGNALIVGITGSPGVGKSTLVEQLAASLCVDRKVGVIAIDPTSPFSGGAILGDRIRMQSLAADPRVFIRSMATRGRLGGLAPSVDDAIVVLSAAGYDMILVETVGVGQDEVEVVQTALVTIVVLSPGMGDDVQTMKAGIMEIGDIFVINKADREGARRTRQELEALLSLDTSDQRWRPPIVETVATSGRGIERLAETIGHCHKVFEESGLAYERSLKAHRQWLSQKLKDEVAGYVLGTVSDSEMDRLAGQIMERQQDPFEIVSQLLKRCLKKPVLP